MEGVPVQVELPVGMQYQVIPSYVDTKCSANIFNVQLVQNEEIQDLIQEHCNERNKDLVAFDPEKLRPGSMCIAKYGEDSNYYRGFIDAVDKERRKATVTFFDYGNTENVSFEDIAQVPGMLRSLVPQAYHCQWKNNTKQGLKKLYALQCDEAEVAIEIVGKRYDERMRAMIYTVKVPSLECKPENPGGNTNAVGTNICQEKKVENNSAPDFKPIAVGQEEKVEVSSAPDFAPPLPLVPPPINVAVAVAVAPADSTIPEQVKENVTVATVVTEKEEFKVHVQEEKAEVSSTPDFTPYLPSVLSPPPADETVAVASADSTMAEQAKEIAASMTAKDEFKMNVGQEEKVEVSSAPDFAPPLPLVPPPVNVAVEVATAGSTKAEQVKAKEIVTPMTAKQEFKIKASATQGTTSTAPTAPTVGPGPGMAKIGSYAPPPRKGGRSRFDIDALRALPPRGGSKTDTGTMTMPNAENGQPITSTSGGAGDSVDSASANPQKMQEQFETFEMLRHNPEFVNAACTFFAVFAKVLNQAGKK